MTLAKRAALDPFTFPKRSMLLPSRLPALPRAYLHSWRQHGADARDAELMRIYTATRPVLLPHKRMLLLAGLAGFDRQPHRL